MQQVRQPHRRKAALKCCKCQTGTEACSKQQPPTYLPAPPAMPYPGTRIDNLPVATPQPSERARAVCGCSMLREQMAAGADGSTHRFCGAGNAECCVFQSGKLMLGDTKLRLS